jgi:hypothetical protein
MAIELDHVFICVAEGGPEAVRLVQFGLLEGAPNVHPGQGTANRRFFFRTAMLELLWVQDPIEAQSDQTASTKLWERWSGRSAGACPFGMITRPATAGNCDPPFPASEYRPKWLPAGLQIYVSPAGPEEPMWVYMPFLIGSDRQQHFVEHPNAVRDITNLTLQSPGLLRSAAAQVCMNNGVFTHQPGPEHLLVIEFDNGSRHEVTDFRPDLPLVVRR